MESWLWRMKATDYLFILKNRFLKKDNVLLILIISFIFVAIFSCITMINFVSVFRSSMLSSDMGRTLIIDKPKSDDDLIKIKELKNVEVIESNKYLMGVEIYVPEFNKPKAEGMIELLPLLKENDVKIIKGSKIQNAGDIICPKNLYPHSLYTGNIYNYETNYFGSYLLKANNLIGSSITVENENEKIALKIVGTFENKILNGAAACYISKTDFNKFKEDIEYCSNDECYEYTSLMLRVDDYNNLVVLEKELKDLGYNSIRNYTFDEEILSSLSYIPLFVGSIVMIISMLIIYSFFKKKIRNNQYQYGVLKSVGYTNFNIKIIAILEGGFITTISILWSVVLYFISYHIVANNYLQELSYNNFTVPVPYAYIALFVFVVFIYIFLIINYLSSKSLNACIQKLFEGE